MKPDTEKQNWIILLTSESSPPKAFGRAVKESEALVGRPRIFCASAEHHAPLIGEELPSSQVTKAPFERGDAWQALLALLEILRKNPAAQVALVPLAPRIRWKETLGPMLKACFSRGEDSREIILLGLQPGSPGLIKAGNWLLPSGIPQGGIYPEVCTRSNLSPADALELRQMGGLYDASIWVGPASTLLLAYAMAASQSLKPFYDRMVGDLPCARFEGLHRIYAELPFFDLSRDLVNAAPDFFRALALPFEGWSLPPSRTHAESRKETISGIRLCGDLDSWQERI